MSGTICYCSREDHVLPPFTACLARLAQQHPDCLVLPVISTDIADARNTAVQHMKGDWLWFIDTDMVFAPEIVTHLLAHNVDVVQALCLLRHPPHPPVLWSHDPRQRDPAPIGSPRLIEVQSLGAGGTLFRRECFESVKPPWFEGILGTEDTTFAQKLKQAGIPLHVDLTAPVGHMTPVVVWPEYDRTLGQWFIKYEFMTGHAVKFPAAQGMIHAPLVATR